MNALLTTVFPTACGGVRTVQLNIENVVGEDDAHSVAANLMPGVIFDEIKLWDDGTGKPGVLPAAPVDLVTPHLIPGQIDHGLFLPSSVIDLIRRVEDHRGSPIGS